MAKNAGRYAIAGDLALVFAVALGLRLMWVVIIPPWTAPDESSHFTYVSHLAEQGELPRPGPYEPAYPDYSVEVSSSWDLFLFPQISLIGGPRSPALLPYFPIAHDYRPARAHKAPPEQRVSAAGATATDYPPLYYLVGTAFYRLFDDSTLLSRIFAVRAASGLLGALSCCFGYLLAYELRQDRRWGYALGMSMAMMPMYVFITSSVNNDVGVFLTSTVLCWLIVRAFRRATLSAASAACIGLVSGLVLLTKPSGVSVVLAAGLVVLYRCFPWRRGPARFDRARLLALTAYAGGVLLIAVPWVALRVITASELPAESTTDEVLVDSILSTPRHSIWAYLRHQQTLGFAYFQRLFVTTYWGCFGWLEVMLPQRVYKIILFLYAMSGVGLVAQWIRRPAVRAELGLLAALVLAHGVFLFVVADYYLTFARTGADLGMQGRYFFPTLAPALLLMLSGLHYLLGEHRLFLRMVPFAMLLLQWTGLARMLFRYYGIAIL